MTARPHPPPPFAWRDGERLIRFGPGALDALPGLVEGPYALLTTPRAERAAPALAAAAAEVHRVPPGPVDELAAALGGSVRARVLVALGGGRVIDVAKALAAADGPRTVVAVPTTLSGAEMTAIHRLPAGAPDGTPRVRPAVVLNDPALSASQPEPGLVASAMNALGHAVEGPLTERAHPVAELAAARARDLILGALAAGEPRREALALGALLAGYVIDSTGYGVHHVLSQTLARLAGVGHGPANAAMLPHTIHALAWRRPGEAGWLEEVRRAAVGLAHRAGAPSLSALGVPREALAELADRAAERAEAAAVPPPADAHELRAIYEAAW